MKIKKENLADRFKKIVNKDRNKDALIFSNGKKITFDQLDHFSNLIIKKFFNKKNIHKRVCILSDKNELVYYVIIACLKAGKSYTVLDIEAPIFRNEKIIKTLYPALIFNITNKKIILKKKTKIINKSILIKSLNNNNKDVKSLNIRVNSNTTAYIMFTSGSTGEPKGVSISHHNVLNFIDWSKKEYSFNKTEVFTNLNGLHFDNSIFDVFASLFNGYTLIPLNKSELLDTNTVIKLFKKYKITNWFSVPSLLIYFLRFNNISIKKLPFVKRIIFGGEAFPKNLLKVLFNKVKNKINLYNVYGPTECTCICSSYLINKSDFSKKEMERYAPLGKKMITNFKYKILKDNRKKTSIGEKGELILIGENVGKGYYNNMNETKKKFFSKIIRNKKIKTKFYRTGDIVYKDKLNKFIYFVARADNQVKFMGHRIELNEIEIVLKKNKNIKNCIVTFGKKNNIDEITAWIVSKKKLNNLNKTISKKLPNYMIPRKFNFIENFPINLNGKIDKVSLKKGYYD